MISNNIRLAFRHLSRQKVNSFLHFAGLTIGLSVCLLIGLFLRYELSFDAYHEKTDRTYRIISQWRNTDEGDPDYHYSTPISLSAALRNGVSGIEHVVLAMPGHDNIIDISTQKRLKLERVLITDAEFLEVFDVEVLQGNAHEALRKPYQALLTETTARQFFGREDPMGKTFTYRKEFNITVAGIIRDFPPNTHLPASMILSFVPNKDYLGTDVEAWTYVNGASTFVVLPDRFDMKNFEAQLKALADENMNTKFPKHMRGDFLIQPLDEVHFETRYGGGGEWVQSVNTWWLWFFAAIGLAVLALACINFVNLSTAQAISRAKEVGIRKAVGAARLQLLGQFLTEAWMFTFLAGIFSVAVAQLSLPFMNTLLEKQISFDLFDSPVLLLSMAVGLFLTGLLAGLYPAYVIARFNPALSLKSGLHAAGDYSSSWLRKSLVVAQFTISAGLLITVALIAQQVSFLRNRNLGFNKDNIVTVDIGARKAQVFANELRGIHQVKELSFATSPPSHEYHWGTMMSLIDGDDPARKNVTLILGDENYGKMYGLRLLSGRFPLASDSNFVSRQVPDDKKVMKVVVNEKLVSALGLGSNEEALGKTFWIGFGGGHAEVVGVIADFNSTSLHQAIAPTLITNYPQHFSTVGIKIEAGSDIPEIIAAIESAWKKVFTDGVFEFKFLDDQILASYKAETRLYALFKIFAGLAILISCMGLWGLVALSARQRIKEIGIRKVLGASVNAIVMLLSRDFLLLVTLALFIAIPLAWLGMTQWLTNFAYHIDIQWHVFALAGAASVVIAILTMSFQAVKAALANPVDSLRNE